MRPSQFRSAFAGLLVIAITLVLVAAAFAQEEVDFSRPPAAGLKYKVVTKSSSEGSQSVTMGERAMEFTVTGERASTFTVTILEVKEGKIAKLEREYEDVSNKQAMTAEGQEPRERDTESPLSWKHFRVEWNADGEAVVKLKDEDEWKDPEEQLKKRLGPKRLRRALFPLPNGTKKVGDTWELSEETTKAYFPVRRMRDRDGGEGPEVTQEVTGTLEFAQIADHREMKCAVIKASLELKVEVGDNGSTTTKLVQTCYYSLEHRVVVGIKGTTEASAKMTRTRGEMSMDIASTSKGSSDTVVTIEQAGKKEEAGE